MLDIYIDGDACPVKEEVLKVAGRHGLQVLFVSNRWSRKVDAPNVRQVVVTEGFDAADNWIAENAKSLLRQAPKNKPWHLVVNFTGPHNPVDITASKRFLDQLRP